MRADKEEDPMTYRETAVAIVKRAVARGDTAWATQLAKQLATDTASYEQLRQEGDLLFRVGLAPSPWEGMAQHAAEHPELVEAIRAEERATHSDRRTARPEADATDTPPRYHQESDMDTAHNDRLTKGAPAAPPTATEAWLACIAKRQTEQPELTYIAASDVARREEPALYAAYTAAMRLPQHRGQPVAKREPLAPEAVQKMVDAHVAQHPEEPRMAAWQAVLTAHEGTEAFGAVYEQYRKYQTSDEARRDHIDARLATGRAGQAS
jgi:hypothetical protein